MPAEVKPMILAASPREGGGVCVASALDEPGRELYPDDLIDLCETATTQVRFVVSSPQAALALPFLRYLRRHGLCALSVASPDRSSVAYWDDFDDALVDAIAGRSRLPAGPAADALKLDMCDGMVDRDLAMRLLWAFRPTWDVSPKPVGKANKQVLDLLRYVLARVRLPAGEEES